MNTITESLARHYSETFAAHGASSEGVDWGANTANVQLRYQKMLQVIKHSPGGAPTLLDVGCGYGGLLQYAANTGCEIAYTGVDAAQNMIDWASVNQEAGRFLCGDVLTFPFSEAFDYVVCSGILTQKLDTPGLHMDKYASSIIRRMFSLCRVGIAFNVMTTKVNHFAPNLYYRNPAELLSWCMSELTPHVRLDHDYPMYEYTMYLYSGADTEQEATD